MADVIKSDIEKIERALNIRVDDVEIEVALNAAFPQAVSKLFDEQQIKIEQLDELIGDDRFEDTFPTPSPRVDQSSLLTFATALNFCYQRKLSELSKHCQALSTTEKLSQSSNEILPVQILEFHTDQISSCLTANNESLHTVRRMMQREEKARLSSTETIEKLIECVAQSIRKNKEHELTRRIEILQTSTRDTAIVDQELQKARRMLEDSRVLSNRELIEQENDNSSIDWAHISETLMNNQYTEKCCRRAWQQLCLPVISHNEKWSAEEDQSLRELVQNHGPYADQWVAIAHNFPQRSPIMCVTRYMSLDNDHLDKTKFSTDRLNQLRQVVDEDRHENYIPLNKVAYRLGCSLSTIHREWRRIDPDVRRGQWQVDEDEALLRSVLKQSNRGTINWNLVACDIPGRSQTKCYNRYVHLTRERVKTDFGPEDDQLLLEQHQLQNARWSQIQPFFPGRSCYTLQNRLRKLAHYRQINELFHSQQIPVQSFLLRQFPSKEPVTSIANNPYLPPSIQLTFDQLQCLISNPLFIQLCHDIDLHGITTSVGIRQLLNRLPTFTDVDEMKLYFYSNKRTRRTANK